MFPEWLCFHTKTQICRKIKHETEWKGKLSRGGKEKKNRVEKMKRDSSQAKERGEEAVW